MNRTLRGCLELIRVSHWVKNGLVFAPLFFANNFFDLSLLVRVGVLFVCVSLLASAGYVWNDLRDVNLDRLHNKKRFRPIASGVVPENVAFGILVFLVVVSTVIAKLFIPSALPLLLSYGVLNMWYSWRLKNIVLVEMICVVLFFLFRILAGGVVASVHLSPWLILCTIFLSLFLVSAKRYAGLSQPTSRPVLKEYSRDFLVAILTASGALAVMSYGLYTILVLRTESAVFTVLPVLVGVFRYVQISFQSEAAEYPEKLLWRDKIIVVCILFWVLSMYLIFYN